MNRKLQHGGAPLRLSDGPTVEVRKENEALKSILNPSDPTVLALAVVDTLVIASDPMARHASIAYWERGRQYALAVVEAMGAVKVPGIRRLAAKLMADSTHTEIYYELTAQLAEIYIAIRTDALQTLFDSAWLAECNSRLGFYLGPHYDPSGACAVSPQALSATHSGSKAAEGADVPVLVVVPFRDGDSAGPRVRNLLACLLSLHDQSAPRESYRIVVVESDNAPRWREVITPHTDSYLFARKTGAFNKSWAVNVGVINGQANAELICILDADVLVDREFITRNVARFRKSGTMGHLSYRDMWCLDEKATSFAIRQRIYRREFEANPDHLRAFVLRRPPGACVWVRMSAFRRIGGMDERFEGWGGEDNDFAYRLDTNSAFDSYEDMLLHMYHPPSAVLRADGELVNAHIPGLSWRPDAAIGNIRRFDINALTGSIDSTIQHER